MKKLKIAPYFWISSWKNNQFIVNKGSKQKIICKNEYQNIIKIIEIFKVPRSKNEFNKIIKNSNNFELLKTFEEMIKDNLFINNEYNSLHAHSRNHLFLNYLYGDFEKLQKKIKNKKIVLVGCGGIGNFVSYFLVSFGFENITIIDGDKIEESNLNRQFLFGKNDINKYKVITLRKKLLKINPNIKIKSWKIFIENIDQIKMILKEKYDLIIVSADEKQILQKMVLFSKEKKVPLINVGYLNDIAVIGPFYIPKKTACPFCGNAIFPNNKKNIIINDSFAKAPSTFINNSLASSLIASEILNYFFNPSKMLSINKRIGINSLTFDKSFFEIKKNPLCSYCN